MSSVNPNIKYRPDIDGLRALAILPVVIYHAFPRYAPGGFVGVDIFFVISGFLISLIIFKGLINNNFSFTEFYTHRVKRIFPALILVVSICYVIGWFSLLPDEFKQLGKHIAAGMGFVQNFVLWKEAGYFDVATELKPLMHLWSLAVEEQFYLIFPLFLWILWKSRVNVLTSLFILCLISFILNLKGINKDPTKTFFLPQTRFWELMIGSVIAYFYAFNAWKPSFSKYLNLSVFNKIVFREVPEEKDRKLILSSILSFIGLFLILYAVAAYNHTMPYPGKKAVIPVLGASLLIIAGPHAWVNRHLLSNKAAIWIGLISYPLYLWHWPLLSFARIVESETPSREIRIAAVVISFILAALTYYLIEKRIRYAGYTWKKVATLTLLALIVGYVGYNAFLRNGLEFRTKEYNLISQAIGDWDYPKGLHPVDFDGRTIYLSKKQDPEVLFFGDSHAEQYGPRIVELENSKKIKTIAFLTGGGCPPIPNVYEDFHKHCSNIIDDFWNYLEINTTVKTVIISACFNCYFIYQSEPASSREDKYRYYLKNKSKIYFFRGGDGRNMAIEAFHDFTNEIISKGYKLYILMDNPADIRFSPSSFLRSEQGRRPFNLLDNNLNFSTKFPIDLKQVVLEDDLKNGLLKTGATVINTSLKICPEGICTPFDKFKNPIYKDSNHIRPFYVIDNMNILDEIIVNQ